MIAVLTMALPLSWHEKCQPSAPRALPERIPMSSTMIASLAHLQFPSRRGRNPRKRGSLRRRAASPAADADPHLLPLLTLLLPLSPAFPHPLQALPPRLATAAASPAAAAVALAAAAVKANLLIASTAQPILKT